MIHKLLDESVICMSDQDQSFENKIKQVKENIQTIYSKIMLLNENSNKKLVCYFTYSINIIQDEENVIIGSLHLTNFGNIGLNNPIFLIRITSEQEITLSGKFSQKGNNSSSSSWKRIELEATNENKEYWFQPTEQVTISPGETISFPNFQISWKHQEHYNVKIEGFSYCDEVKEGVSSLSPITLYS